MSLKRLCDCCGKPIHEVNFMVLNLLPITYVQETRDRRNIKKSWPNQELCDSCATEVYEHYRLMKANKQGKTLKRVCLNCGHEDDDNPVCPVCKSQNWGIEEV